MVQQAAARFEAATLAGIGLGAIVLVQGLRERDAPHVPQPAVLTRLWPVIVVTAALVAFAFWFIILVRMTGLADREVP